MAQNDFQYVSKNRKAFCAGASKKYVADQTQNFLLRI